MSDESIPFVINNECSKCHNKYQLDEGNAVLHWYKKRMYLANVEMVCPKCEHVEYMFIDDEWVGPAFATNWPRKVHDDAEGFLLDAWQQIYGELVTYRPLTKRLEGEVNDLCILLAVTPDEWILEVFSAPPPRSIMPLTWG